MDNKIVVNNVRANSAGSSKPEPPSFGLSLAASFRFLFCFLCLLPFTDLPSPFFDTFDVFAGHCNNGARF